MTVGYHNIFPMEKSDQYLCTLYRYEIGHSGMYIRVSEDNETQFYLLFVDVRYFSGPTDWQSSDFHLVEKPTEHLKILDTLGCFSKWPKDILLERMRIYTVKTSDTDITIVASDVERLDELPQR